MNTSFYSNTEKLNIANTMFSQLGGYRFQMMTGAKIERIYERDGKVVLRTTVGRNCHSVNRFEMAYNEGQDLYELRFIRNRAGVDKIVNEYDGVYCDMLGELFEKETGMTLIMPRFVCA